jgi:uncharacterized protein YqfA (UPF0365 family)
MKITLGEHLAMRLRGSSVGLIRSSGRRLQEAGIPVPIADLQVQVLAGGDLNRVTEAMIAARIAGVPATWAQLSALDLKGSDPVQAVRASEADQELAFDSYSSSESEKIVGYTKDGSRVEATVRATYRPPLIPNLGGIEHLQDRLAVKLAVIINTAAGPSELELRRDEWEAQLLAIATGIISSVRRVQVELRPVVE